MQKKIILVFTTTLIYCNALLAQSKNDTLNLTLPQAEKIFIQKNLSLLAAKYNVDVNEALIQQAKYWDNPVLSTDQNLYDGAKGDGKLLAHNASRGQLYVQVMQLIKTADKRNKLAQLATDNTLLAKQQFDDVLRSLHYTLQNDLLEINHQLKLKKVYEAELVELQHLIIGMDAELKAGNAAQKDVMRLKTLQFSLQNEIVNIEAAIMPVQTELKFLLQSTDNKFIAPILNYKFANFTTETIPNTDSLIKIAIANRADIKMAQTNLDLSTHNLIYQKAMAKPDVSVGVEYDQRSSYNPNYVGLAVSLPLNVFNKNQGNIKSAQANIKLQQVQQDFVKSKIENEINAAVTKFNYYQQVNNLQQLDFSKKYDELFSNMLKSYRERQISLLEFIDFVDAYKDTKLKLIEQHNNLVKSISDLNYTTNSNVITIN